VAEAAEALAEWLEGLLEGRKLGRTDMLGPAPCPIDRLRGRWRWHLLLKSDDAGELGAVLRYLARRDPVPSGIRLEIDRDPEHLL
jgi:primosomal protein N' (replication factor Y)